MVLSRKNWELENSLLCARLMIFIVDNQKDQQTNYCQYLKIILCISI